MQDHCVPNIDTEKVREKRSVEVNSKGCSSHLPGGKKTVGKDGHFPPPNACDVCKKLGGRDGTRMKYRKYKKNIGSLKDIDVRC